MDFTEVDITNDQRILNFAAQPLSDFKPRAVIIVELDQKPRYIGNINQGIRWNPEIIVRKRLNTVAGDFHSFGLKVLFRRDLTAHQNPENYVYDDISFMVDSSCCRISHRAVARPEKNEFMDVAPSRDVARMFLDQELHRIEFVPFYGRQAFLFDRAEISAPQASNPYVQEAYLSLMSINQASKVVLLLYEDRHLLSQLYQTLDEHSPQTRSAMFTFSKHPVPQWMSNRQVQMVAGMADMPNIIFYDAKLVDGRGTSLASRPLARGFKELMHSSYHQLRSESLTTAFPVFLNVPDGECKKDGFTEANLANKCVGVNTIQRLLACPVIGKAAIGILTLCLGQVRSYRVALLGLHSRDPTIGYDKVSIVTPSQMEGKQLDFVVFDMVRTGKIESIEEYILETKQLREALIVHRDGLIVVGKLAEGSDQVNSPIALPEGVHNTFWHVSKWFLDHNRVVDVFLGGLFNGPISSLRPTNPQIGRLSCQTSALPVPNAFGTSSAGSQRQTCRKGPSGSKRDARKYGKQDAARHPRRKTKTQRISKQGSATQPGYLGAFNQPRAGASFCRNRRHRPNQNEGSRRHKRSRDAGSILPGARRTSRSFSATDSEPDVAETDRLLASLDLGTSRPFTSHTREPYNLQPSAAWKRDGRENR